MLPQLSLFRGVLVGAVPGRAGRAEEALSLFELMKLEGCRPNLITFNAAIDACTKGGVPLDRAWSLFQQMQDAGIHPDRVRPWLNLDEASPPSAHFLD